MQKSLSHSEQKTRKTSRTAYWLLVGAALLATGISLAIGVRQSVWFDEAYSIFLATQPVGELIRLTALDTHPPLYYLLLKGWAALFGWSELALRSLSALAFGGAVFTGGVLVKRFFDTRAMLYTLPLMVLAPLLLRYGFEIRMYAVAGLIGVAATYVLLGATTTTRKTSWKLYILYAVLVALGVYTLYYSVLLWLTHAIWLIWLTRSRKESILRQRWWLAFGGALLLFAPWLPKFLSQMTNDALAPIGQQLTVENAAGVATFFFFSLPSWQLDGWGTLALVGLLSLVASLLLHAKRVLPAAKRPQLTMVAMYALLPILLIALIALWRPMYVERYLAHVMLGLSLLLGVCLWLVGKTNVKKALVAGGALLACLAWGVVHLAHIGNYNFQRSERPSVAQAAEVVNNTCNDSKLVVASPYEAIELRYFVKDCPIYFYAPWETLGGGYAPLSGSSLQIRNPDTQLGDPDKITFVHYGDNLPFALPANYKQTASHDFGILHVKQLTR